MNKKKNLPKCGRPPEKPPFEKLVGISQFQTLEKEALAITCQYEATKNWGTYELRIVFSWMFLPDKLDACRAFASDEAAKECLEISQKLFARLFAVGPDIIEPLKKLHTLFKRASRTKDRRSAMDYGRKNDGLKLWNEARKKSGLPPVPLSHVAEIWDDKADALAGRERSARDVADLRAHLRQLAKD